jgi:hypothetical protein
MEACTVPLPTTPPRSHPAQFLRRTLCSLDDMRIVRMAITAVATMTFAAVALALPQPGDGFPRLSAQDLTGLDHSTDELIGHRTLVVAITDRHAVEAMRAWYKAADMRVPPNVMRESIISIHLPFFVSTSYAQSKAREQTPRQYWHATLLDRGDLANHLGLDDGQVPYVFVLDGTGRVVAAVHATVDSPQANEVWNGFAER